MYEQIEKSVPLCVALSHKRAVYYHSQARHQASMHGPSLSSVKNLIAAFQGLADENEKINHMEKYVVSIPR